MVVATNNLRDYLEKYVHTTGQGSLFDRHENKTHVVYFSAEGRDYPTYINEYWTAKQRQANSLHEIAYRACFKPQLPRFFIELFTAKGDIVYDPFSGRGTTVIEAAILGRNIISNDINPLSQVLSYSRLLVPRIAALDRRLKDIPINYEMKTDIDLSMFYHPETAAEITSLKNYLIERKKGGKEDALDLWIRMVATNRLTGHSRGFFSVYTLPPNQAVSTESQIKINAKRNQKPEYRDTKTIILKKSVELIRDISDDIRRQLCEIAKNSCFLTRDARFTNEIEIASVSLTVTSPPFLDIVQYVDDNWLRCWFNDIDVNAISAGITMSKTLSDWCAVMGRVFDELYRIAKVGGWIAFEVGEIRGGRICLDEHVVPLGVRAGFSCEGILINQQTFTKTANIWGISNNDKGTNSNRIVLFNKR